MRNTVLGFMLLFCAITFAQDKYVLVIHGGAGSITKGALTPEQENEYREALQTALLSGYSQLKQGKSSVEAVQQAIIVLENSPLFNAGKGAVFTHEGNNELDASIMDGSTQNAGAVAGVKTIKNPILAAKAVMTNSPHVLLSREGAEEFAQEQGLEIVSPSYFYTEDNYNRLQQILDKEKSKVSIDNEFPDWKYGTVGAVALDQQGNIAAGTSTGGMTNKRWARVGDSPIIGAGTYANLEVGISSTGWGEYFIRTVATYDVVAQMEYSKISLNDAMQNTLQKIKDMGGAGGMIALDKEGNVSTQFNTPGMFRAMINENGKVFIYFYENDL